MLTMINQTHSWLGEFNEIQRVLSVDINSHRNKIVYRILSQDIGRRRGHVPCSICECSWNFDVCDGLYQTINFTCNGSVENFYVKNMEQTLDNSKLGFRYLYGTSDHGFSYQGRPRLKKVFDIHGLLMLIGLEI